MGSLSFGAFEIVVITQLFPRGREFVAGRYPPSVLAIYDVVTADPGWGAATTWAEQSLVVARVLRERPDLAAAYQSDIDAGYMGFGDGGDDEMDAAIRAVEQAGADERGLPESLPEDGMLGGEDSEGPEWAPSPPPTRGPGLPRPAPSPAAPPPPLPTDEPDQQEQQAEEQVQTGADEGAAESVATWLNAQLSDPATPLRVGRTADLMVFFGEKSQAAVAAVAATITIPAGQEHLDVQIRLASLDFVVPSLAQPHRISREGRSESRAHFDITPKHEGPSKLSVHVDVDGNFLQRLDITFDIGTDAEPEIANYGRPASAAGVLKPRVAKLEFMPAVGGYEVTAGDVLPEPVMIWITQDELGARIKSVREALLGFVSDKAVSLELDLAPEVTDAALRKLAFEGYLLFRALFAGPQASPQLKQIGTWLRESLSDDVRTLQVVSTGFPVPWPLMYLADRFDTTPLSWDNFVGMRHVVEQVTMAKIETHADPTIASTPELSVRVLFNEGIDASMPSHPIAAQREYWRNRGVVLTEGTTVDDLIGTALTSSTTDKVLYLYCHAQTSPSDAQDSCLILTGGERVTLGQLSVFAPWEDALTARPLVFLNACESAELTPDFYDGFVLYFLAKGARGVIGTECKTPGLFASEWAKAFFDELFAGNALGEVVLDLRRRFLSDHNNPLGLLYGVHCDTDTVVAPALVPQSGR
ncbi:CHAT domain-containing protein [Microbacterium ulmi]|uniref:CHAT domain-containing protein n=1 Tax=Microbacterium ulmi TaxID=179095 RepID=A0A7Y2PZK6_9MICO|nr:CHAT domain-containing protein [Microbacterium ulmi]NII71075.1 hypothetical protein [Microbacterium ulmi]NNH02382.1 CHAT domain-containing protein [Microbacterium ulmi]